METTERKQEYFLGRVLKTDEGWQSGQLPALSSIYLTNCIGCEEIFEADCIAGEKYDLQLQNQSIAAEDLGPCVVLFYGSPVCLRNGDAENSLVTNSSCLPCCLILNTSRILPKHIFPFDINSCPKGWDVSDFELPLSLLSIPVYVQRYFSSNDNYLHGKSDKGSIPITSQAEEVLWSLLSDINKTAVAKTVEILCEDIDLADVIEAIIVPDTILGYEDYVQFQKRHNQIDVRIYEARYPSVPNEYSGAIYTELLRYYRKKKVLKRQKRIWQKKRIR